MLPVLGDTVLSVVSPPVLDDTLHGSVKTTYASTEYQHKGLGTVSINIGPVSTQKIEVPPSSIFFVGIICSVPPVYRSDICFGKCTCVLRI